MRNLGFAEAFARYGAKLRNLYWSVCAEAADGSLVLSLWAHHFEPSKDGKVICRDSFARWEGAGNAEFRQLVLKAFKTGQLVRVVLAQAKDPAAVQARHDLTKIVKTYSVKDWKGRVLSIEGDNYAIEFERNGS
jgi:hypothetical protein